ncbi:tyrosine-type recombinase/integrase [Ructibacterium gallinarum]|uniref:Tyrosine-type recombinase/integrase n=1 Tax=Ructibacterium gallinarum TaxID=2779355 RepID=A0A9D5M1R1_9FIRM|nr:tyrosine-type recombinase/integrase [Ructibacterium gallinarum]MBE5040536.1 tyrosine-type recombinase/integrase [Ructibacterium gallinarum]
MKKSDKNLFFSFTYEFLEIYMRVQLTRSVATIESYRDALTVFRYYLRDEKNIRMDSFEFVHCTRDLILDYMNYLAEKGNKPGTRNQRLAALKSYLWFAAEKDTALQSIAISVGRIKSCKNPKKEKPILDETALKLLINAPDNSKMGIRDKTIMILLYDSAARIDEILSLRKQDLNIETDNPFIHVIGKGQKERIIALTNMTCNHLRQYLTLYHSKNCPTTDLLFYTTIKGAVGKMSEANVERFMKKYADSVRTEYPYIPESVHPHMFRRTRATGLYRDGVDLSIVSRFLGHSHLETTRIYATPSVEMIREAINKVPTQFADEEPLWDNSTDDNIAKMCGLR